MRVIMTIGSSLAFVLGVINFSAFVLAVVNFRRLGEGLAFAGIPAAWVPLAAGGALASLLVTGLALAAISTLLDVWARDGSVPEEEG